MFNELRFLTFLLLSVSLVGCLSNEEPAENTSRSNEPFDLVSDKDSTLPVNVPSSTFPKINAYPQAVADKFSVSEDGSILMASLLSNDADSDGDRISIIGFSQGESGARVVNTGGGTLAYITQPDFNGVDRLTYTISDGKGGEATASVEITVNAVNDVPLANPDQLVVDMDVEKIFNILTNDTGLGDVVTIELVSSVSNGSLSSSKLGEYSYSPNSGYAGEDGFIYRLVDSDGDTAIATVTLQVGCADSCRVFRLSWDRSVSVDVVAYRIYMALNNDTLLPLADVGNVREYEHFTMTKGNYLFAVSAINAQNIESELSQSQPATF